MKFVARLFGLGAIAEPLSGCDTIDIIPVNPLPQRQHPILFLNIR